MKVILLFCHLGLPQRGHVLTGEISSLQKVLFFLIGEIRFGFNHVIVCGDTKYIFFVLSGSQKSVNENNIWLACIWLNMPSADAGAWVIEQTVNSV